MTHNGVRIGRIRPKRGGDIHVLPVEPRSDAQQGLLESAVDLIASLPEMAGYVVVVWDETATPWCHSWIEDPEVSPVSAHLLPSFIHDALLTHFILDPDDEE
jgi:hypothetical protein